MESDKTSDKTCLMCKAWGKASDRTLSRKCKIHDIWQVGDREACLQYKKKEE